MLSVRPLFRILMALFLLVSMGLPLFSQTNTASSTNASASVPTKKKSDHYRLPFKVLLELGYRNSFAHYYETILSSNSYTQGVFTNEPNHGLMANIDLAYQIGGLDGRLPAVYLSIPLGFTALFDQKQALFQSDPFVTNGVKGSGINGVLAYGFNIRHDFLKGEIRPFVAYGLLLNQLFFNNAFGRILGHETRFDLGMELLDKNGPFSGQFRLSFSIAIFGELGRKESFYDYVLTAAVGVALRPMKVAPPPSKNDTTLN